MSRLTAACARILDAIFGPRCRLGCGERVFVRDVGWHEELEHAGDRAGGGT